MLGHDLAGPPAQEGKQEGEQPPGRKCLSEGGYARCVDPKTRNRIMAGVLVLMFVVVALAAAVG
ncbi:hypothetical protein QF026_003936 [Streptomyces aurantiacus]|nr:hypothetical protein [Streptomyces aurantiacus]